MSNAHRSRRLSRPRLGTAGLALVGAVLLGSLGLGRAASIGTGSTPTDTCIRTDGAVSYVLSSGSSTLGVVNTTYHTLIRTVNLGQAANVCKDIDWHAPSARVLVGCTNGKILSVNPTNGAVTTTINNPGANYSVICADNYLSGSTGWGVDASTGWLHQFTGGSAVAQAAVPFSTSVELVEKRTLSGSSSALDANLYIVGNGTSTAEVVAFDRSSMTMGTSVSAPVSGAVATGIATSTGSDAFVTANVSGAGRLYRLTLSTLAFASTALGSFSTAAVDVSVAGAFVLALTVQSGSAGAVLEVYDIGDPASILYAGHTAIGGAVNPAGGYSTSMGAGGTLQDIYSIHVNASTTATAENLSAIQGDFVYAAPPTVASGIEAQITSTLAGIPDQEARPCGECMGQTAGVTSGPIFGDGYVDPFSASAASVQYATGEELFRLPLVSVPGVGRDMDFTLTYRSRRDFDYRYGNSWFLNKDERLFQQTNGDENHHDGSGRIDKYALLSGTYVTPIHHDTVLSAGSSSMSISDRLGDTGTFNALGYKVAWVDRHSNSESYTWSSDKLTGTTDTLGRNYSLTYDSTGRLSTLSDFGGRTWTMAYDYMGNLRSVATPTSTQFPQGRTRFFSYSPNNSVKRLTSNLVHVWSWKGTKVQTLTYDSDDLATGERLGSGTYTFSYNASASTRTVVDRAANTTQFTFDANAMVTRVERFTKGLRSGEPTSYVTTYTIGTNGYPASVVLPRGNRLDFTYNSSLDLTEIRRKETNTSSTSSTDLVTTMTYGVYSQLASVTDPLGSTTTFSLNSTGDTTGVSRPTVTSPSTQTSSSSMTYDSLGRITSATDAESRVTNFTYYTSGARTGYLQSVVRDPSGAALTTTLDYDQYGNVTGITDARGHATAIAVDEENYPTEATLPSPFSFRTKITYDANRSVTKVERENVDRLGVTDATTPWIDTTATYDDLGRVLTATRRLTSSLTATSAFEYSGAGQVTKSTTAEGSQTTFEYDERQLLFKATRGYGTAQAATVQFDYSDNGELVTSTDGRGNASTFTYDLFGRSDRATNELGHYVTLAYDKAGHPTTVEAKTSAGTLLASATNSYDEVGRLWRVVESRFGSGISNSTPTTTIVRDKSDRILSVTDPLGNVLSRAYDALGRLASITDAAGDSTSYAYDENGNVTQASTTQIPTAGGSETFVSQFVYDELNRMIARKEIDRTNSSNILQTGYQYDSRGNLTFLLDAEGHPTRYTYDLANRLLQRERALSVGSSIDTFVTEIQESFAYDKDDRLTSLVDDNFQATTYAMDVLNRVSQVTYADTRSVGSTYDLNGNVLTTTDQNGSVVTNTYDAHNRLTARSVSRGTGVQGTTGETFTYDALDRLLTAVDDDFQVENSWDSVGNLLQQRQGYTATGAEKWKTVSYAYDDAGRTSGITYPSSFALGHARDSIGRMTALQDIVASVNIAAFTYQGAGRLAMTTNQNGTSTHYAYDGFARVSTIDHLLSGGGSFHTLEYAYDKVHNRRMEKNSYSSTWIATLPSAAQTFLNGRNGKGDVYAYDWAYRLVDARYDVTSPLSEVASPGSQTYAKLVTYTLDGLGNRSQVQTTLPPGSPTTVTYATDVVNQYTTVGGTSRSHDNNGNVSDDGTYLFKYDYRNHISEVKLKLTSAQVATYRYDALGRRVEKAVNGGATTRMVYAGLERIEDYDGSNVWQARYYFEDGIDQVRAMDRADQADVNGNSNTTEVLRFSYHQNAIGSVTELTQPTGAVVEWETYDVYGNPTIYDRTGAAQLQSPVGNPYLFTGREQDSETGLYHVRARSYDSNTGRFLQRDPLGFVGGCSQYEYCASSPGSMSDPLGTDPESARQAEIKAVNSAITAANQDLRKAQNSANYWGTQVGILQQLLEDAKRKGCRDAITHINWAVLILQALLAAAQAEFNAAVATVARLTGELNRLNRRLRHLENPVRGRGVVVILYDKDPYQMPAGSPAYGDHPATQAEAARELKAYMDNLRNITNALSDLGYDVILMDYDPDGTGSGGQITTLLDAANQVRADLDGANITGLILVGHGASMDNVLGKVAAFPRSGVHVGELFSNSGDSPQTVSLGDLAKALGIKDHSLDFLVSSGCHGDADVVMKAAAKLTKDTNYPGGVYFHNVGENTPDGPLRALDGFLRVR